MCKPISVILYMELLLKDVDVDGRCSHKIECIVTFYFSSYCESLSNANNSYVPHCTTL